MKNKSKLSDLPSIANFKTSIEKTSRLIRSIIGNVTATEALLKILSKTDTKIYAHPIAKSLKLEKEDKEYIYELGFVALFANFEAFSNQLIKDLLNKYPKSLKESDKTITMGEVISIKSGKKIKDYMIDQIAIEKSGSIEDWFKYLDSVFNIKALPNGKFLEQICILNELRNIFVHSGGIANALFIKKMKKYFKTAIPLNHKMDFINREKYFHILYHLLIDLHTNIARQ